MFDEQQFEWVFVVPDISEADDSRIDTLNQRCDAVVESHGGLSLVSTLTQGQSALDAATVALQMLEDSGLRAVRTYPDLVTRADIAVRAQKTRQAVDNWVRGDRQQDFPNPVHMVGGGLWLWRDVDEWLQRERIKDLPDNGGVQYPSLMEHALIDSRLATRGLWFVQGGMAAPGFSWNAPVLTTACVDVLVTPSRAGAGAIKRLIEDLGERVRHTADEPRGTTALREIESSV